MNKKYKNISPVQIQVPNNTANDSGSITNHFFKETESPVLGKVGVVAVHKDCWKSGGRMMSQRRCWIRISFGHILNHTSNLSSL